MTSKKSPPLIACLLRYVTVILSVVIFVVAGVKSSIYTPIGHLDGAFQTASGLFRLDSGQFPGKDFYPYLGVGPLLVIFPIYKFFGGDLAATVAAAKFTTMFLRWMAVSTLWYFILRPTQWIDALIGGALLLIGIDFLCQASLLTNWLAFGMEPGNSLRPVRASLPYLVSLSIYFIIKTIGSCHVRNFLISVTLGVALLWSNDFAIPTFGCFLIFKLFYFYCFERNCVCKTSFIAATSIVVWFGLLFLITAGHPIKLLKYNFIDVAQDQWWYFGPYDENSRIFSISQLTRLFYAENYFPLLVLFAALFLVIKTRRLEIILLLFLGLTLFVGGSLASIGGSLRSYFSDFYFWGAVTSFLFGLKTLMLVRNSDKWIFFLRPCFAFLGLLLIGLTLCMSLQDYKRNLKQVQSDENMFYVDEFGSFLDVAFQEYIDYARKNRDLQAIEDYWGLWSAINRRFPTWPVDSAIHALGSVRETSRESLRSAELTITTRYLSPSRLHPWGLSQNFWFYDELISKWEPVLTSPTTIVWRRAQQSRAFIKTACHMSADKSYFTLPQAEPGFYKIRLDYSSRGGRHLVLVRNNISDDRGAPGFISLMPGAHMATFPVSLISQEEDENKYKLVNTFNIKVIGDAHAEILSCAADRIVWENDELFLSSKASDFYLTDATWINGVARHWAGFFTPNTEENRIKFKVGGVVIFKNGDKRSVVSTTENGDYFNVWVDGPILDPEDVGLPSKYKVLQ